MTTLSASAYRIARRIVVVAVGSTVLLIGIVLLVTPGPAIVVLPIGLAILGLEFAWARRWRKRARELATGNSFYKSSSPSLAANAPTPAVH